MSDWADERALKLWEGIIKGGSIVEEIAQALREARIKGEVGGLIEGRRRGLEEAAQQADKDSARWKNKAVPDGITDCALVIQATIALADTSSSIRALKEQKL